LSDKNKVIQDLKSFEALGARDEELILKLNEFLVLLDQSNLNTENIKGLKTTINTAIDQKLSNKDLVKELKEVSLADLNKLEQLDQLEILLNTNYIDSKQTRKMRFDRLFGNIVKIVIGFLFVTLGFAMIIMPAPPYFEMFTIFYFNPNDGVTLMDLISLIIIATGIYIIIKPIASLKSNE
jgi:hypothetical protein